MKLSIIIPAYNAEPYIEHLINRLKPQIRDDVEVLVIDDGSKFPYLPPYSWVRVITKERNEGLSKARNDGIDNTTGEYIHFIDADDLVPENYIEYILNLLDQEHPDYVELSWKSLLGHKFDFRLRSEKDSLPNPSVCTRIFKRTFLGTLRFNENKEAAEDEDLFRRIDFSKGKKAVATEYMYFYRDTPNSLSKRYRDGKTKTKRIIYFYEHVTSDMTWLIDEIKRESKYNEILVMTRKNDLENLEKYAAVIPCVGTYAHEIRGEANRFIELRRSIETQVVVYMSHPYSFGGRETFIYNFCRQMSKHYDITVVFDDMNAELQARLIPYVPVMKNDKKMAIRCDSIILNSCFDKIPQNIDFKQSIQMVHGCQSSTAGSIPDNRDVVVCVSQAVKDSFKKEDAIVIRNMTSPGKVEKDKHKGERLKLITASRLNTDPRWEDKGATRMIQLAKMLHENNIDFEWEYYADMPIQNAPEGMIFKPAKADVRKHIAQADYLIQLSGAEAFCYSVVEALEIGVPVIVTDLPVFKELKIEDGKNGYVVPLDLKFNINKIKKIPEFKYKYNNGTLVTLWKKVLGNTRPKDNYVPEDLSLVRVIRRYRDLKLQRVLNVNDKVLMTKERARKCADAGFVVIMEG